MGKPLEKSPKGGDPAISAQQRQRFEKGLEAAPEPNQDQVITSSEEEGELIMPAPVKKVRPVPCCCLSLCGVDLLVLGRL